MTGTEQKITWRQQVRAIAVNLSTGLRRDNPNYLLNLFGVLVGASFVSILLVAGAAIYWIQSSAMLRNAEANVVGVGKAILSAEVDTLLREQPDGSLALGAAAADLPRLDAQMKRYLRLFAMREIVIYDALRTVIYSTDSTRIGRSANANVPLDLVLTQGRLHSRIVSVPREPGTGQASPEALVVESYSPIGDARGRVLGAFEIHVDISKMRGEIEETLLLSLGSLAAVLAACLFSLYRPMRDGTQKLVAAHRELSELATRDHLTGIYNRRHIADRVKQEFHRWRRRTVEEVDMGSIGFIMADIDHFKNINDTYGHAVGDEVLREVARRIGEGLREYDMLGRYGGEEFLIMLPNASLDEALAVAERLRWSVGGHGIAREGGEDIRVTASFGVACADGEDRSEQDIIHHADQALYQAKNSGRNRVVPWRHAAS